MYKKKPGYFELGKIHGVPIYMHWSFLIVGLLIAAFFNSSIGELLFFVLGYVVLILIHELGHMFAARRFKLNVHAITISGAGGMCYSDNPQTYREAFLFYGGGLIAQIILFFITIIFLFFFGYPTSEGGNAIVLTFLAVNLIFFVQNIIPGKFVSGHESDGRVLWSLVKSYYGKA